MNKCPYCGAEYADDVLECPVDHTARAEPDQPRYELAPLSTDEQSQDLVTLAKCRTLVEADLVVSRLRAAGIQAFIPDECLMQSIGFNFNTFGYVRVQVTPRDYDAARDLLSGTDQAA